MIKIGETLVSDDVMEQHFVCNLEKCKGACCVEGDAGAPVETEEIDILNEYIEKIKPFMNDAGRAVIEKEGVFDYDTDGTLVTPLVNGVECAFVIFENGTTFCAIEKAFNAGVIDYRKPISCHLYPIRIVEYAMYDALNYHKWPICSDACSLGKELKVPIYKFAKPALLRKYGPDWYEELEYLIENKNIETSPI
ncbi:MAG: DUF3109 family protein [Bacteroidales bacterium]|nr:DUF3109 family protein [Bacteroidales bacterium]